MTSVNARASTVRTSRRCCRRSRRKDRDVEAIVVDAAGLPLPAEPYDAVVGSSRCTRCRISDRVIVEILIGNPERPADYGGSDTRRLGLALFEVDVGQTAAGAAGDSRADSCAQRIDAMPDTRVAPGEMQQVQSPGSTGVRRSSYLSCRPTSAACSRQRSGRSC
jgi:hypothetical protein